MWVCKVRLEAMFSKKQTQKKPSTHVFHTQHHAYTRGQHTHAHHAHNAHHAHHAFMYAKLYSCTYYGRKGHLAKFYYDKLNISNSYIWVRKTNILGLKKIWVPKSTSLLNDIAMHQGPMT